jgi:hypothetical protein
MLPSKIDEYDELFYVLSLVFIEIRSTDSLTKAQMLADVFHNVPAKIKSGFNLQRIMSEINEKAVRHDCERMISALFSSARKNAKGV